MKTSRYNFRTVLPDGIALYFNFYTLNLLAFESAEAYIAEKILHDPALPDETGLRQLLMDKGFLIDDAIDERAYLHQLHRQACSQHKGLGLTILPTLACNFRCIYCYEKHAPAEMSPEVEEALIAFVKERLQPEASLSVTWFGGEPLLKMDVIERLTGAFTTICEERKTKYSASLITNGYLLSRDIATTLTSLKVQHVQVTLDGPAKVHDARRPLKTGEATYQRILDNLKEASPLLRVNLRINIDQTNRGHIIDLIDLLLREGLGKSVHPYLGRTYPYNAVCSDVAGACITDTDFSLLELETDFELIKRGFHAFRVPQACNTHCLADSAGAFVITPGGSIVNCWNDVAENNAEIGHLLKPQTESMRENMQRWKARDPFALECAECILLPICMGGCPYLYLKNGTVSCHDWKHHLDESLAFYYYLKSLKREGEIAQQFYKAVDEVKELLNP
jgi:uncharacterized protein